MTPFQQILSEFDEKFGTSESGPLAGCDDCSSNQEERAEHRAFLLSKLEEVRKETVLECMKSLPVRSDWDDDERVSAQMVMDTAYENLKCLIEEPIPRI